MCELLGLSFAQPISADFSIRSFAMRDLNNADGWGLAWYPDQSLAMVKEPLSWRSSEHTQFLENYERIRSAIYIGHVRHRTTPHEPSHADTHPFARELDGREYCFAHNGSLAPPWDSLRCERYQPVGHTDSERLFCHLMDAIASRPDRLNTPQSWQWLHNTLSTVNAKGRVNCMLSDGQRLFSYHDAGGWKGLSMTLVRFRQGEMRHLEDLTLAVNLAEDDVVDNYGFVIATQPLNKASWHRFHTSELMVFERGRIMFSSHRRHGTGAAPRCETSAQRPKKAAVVGADLSQFSRAEHP